MQNQGVVELVARSVNTDGGLWLRKRLVGPVRWKFVANPTGLVECAYCGARYPEGEPVACCGEQHFFSVDDATVEYRDAFTDALDSVIATLEGHRRTP